MTWGGWTWPVVLPLLLVWRTQSGNGSSGRRSNEARIAFGVVILMMAGYYLAYAISPYDLAWHIETSIDRVIVQLWPTFLLACFAVAATDLKSTKQDPAQHGGRGERGETYP